MSEACVKCGHDEVAHRINDDGSCADIMQPGHGYAGQQIRGCPCKAFSRSEPAVPTDLRNTP